MKYFVLFLFIILPYVNLKAQNSGTISKTTVRGRDTLISYWVFKQDYEACLEKFYEKWGEPRKNKLGKKMWKKITIPDLPGVNHIRLKHGAYITSVEGKPFNVFKKEEQKQELLKNMGAGDFELITIEFLRKWRKNMGDYKGFAGKGIHGINRTLAEIK